MTRLTAKALNRIEALLDSPDPRIQLGAAIHLTKLGASRLAVEEESDGDGNVIYKTCWGNESPL